MKKVINATRINDFDLTSSNIRTAVGTLLRQLKDELEGVTWGDFFEACDVARDSAWVSSLVNGSAALYVSELEKVAKYFSSFSGRVFWPRPQNSEEDTRRSGMSGDTVQSPEEVELTWNLDGQEATSSNGQKFDLDDQELLDDILVRIRELWPQQLEFSVLVKKAQLQEDPDFLDEVFSGESVMREEDVEAITEFFETSVYSLLSGEGWPEELSESVLSGLDLSDDDEGPEAGGGDSEEGVWFCSASGA